MAHDLARAGDAAAVVAVGGVAVAGVAVSGVAVSAVAAVAADVTPKVPMAMNIATTVRLSLFT
jgi:hypothetical protein